MPNASCVLNCSCSKNKSKKILVDNILDAWDKLVSKVKKGDKCQKNHIKCKYAGNNTIETDRNGRVANKCLMYLNSCTPTPQTESDKYFSPVRRNKHKYNDLYRSEGYETKCHSDDCCYYHNRIYRKNHPNSGNKMKNENGKANSENLICQKNISCTLPNKSSRIPFKPIQKRDASVSCGGDILIDIKKLTDSCNKIQCTIKKPNQSETKANLKHMLEIKCPSCEMREKIKLTDSFTQYDTFPPEVNAYFPGRNIPSSTMNNRNQKYSYQKNMLPKIQTGPSVESVQVHEERELYSTDFTSDDFPEEYSYTSRAQPHQGGSQEMYAEQPNEQNSHFKIFVVPSDQYLPRRPRSMATSSQENYCHETPLPPRPTKPPQSRVPPPKPPPSRSNAQNFGRYQNRQNKTNNRQNYYKPEEGYYSSMASFQRLCHNEVEEDPFSETFKTFFVNNFEILTDPNFYKRMKRRIERYKYINFYKKAAYHVLPGRCQYLSIMSQKKCYMVK